MIRFYKTKEDLEMIVEIITTISMIDRFLEEYLEEYYERAPLLEKNRLDIHLLRCGAKSIKRCNEKERIKIVAELIPKEKISKNFVGNLRRIKDIRNIIDHNMQRQFMNDEKWKMQEDFHNNFFQSSKKLPIPSKTEERTLQQLYDEACELYKEYDNILRCYYAGEEYRESLFPYELREIEEIL